MAATDTVYTQQVKSLVALFSDKKAYATTIVSDALAYFDTIDEDSLRIKKLKDKWQDSESEDAKQKIHETIKELEWKLENARIERVDRIDAFADKLLRLVEGDNEVESNIASAKFLGTLLLIVDRQSKKRAAQTHQVLKPLYKAALAIRLTDNLLKGGKIKHSYLSQYTHSLSRHEGDRYWAQKWRKELAIPIVKAALLQDIGLYHPVAQRILIGPDKDKNPFRVLEDSDRKNLLKLNLQFSLNYIKRGLGCAAVRAEAKADAVEEMDVNEQALAFSLEAVQDATILKNHIGDIIKIPQIYTSFIFSTKSDYKKKDLPKGYMVIEQLMKKGTVQPRIGQVFLDMVGYFPQGFGIAYIPIDETGKTKETYEFGVVNRLFPSNPAEPIVRNVTRQLSFITSGKDQVIKRDVNLYFQANHKKIQHIDKARLDEILSELSGGHDAAKADDIIPQYWDPSDFFSDKQNQSLWTTL